MYRSAALLLECDFPFRRSCRMLRFSTASAGEYVTLISNKYAEDYYLFMEIRTLGHANEAAFSHSLATRVAMTPAVRSRGNRHLGMIDPGC